MKKEKVIRICKQCGKEFSVRGKRKFVANFCCYKCKSDYQIGKPNLSSTKFIKGFIPWNKGKITEKPIKIKNIINGKEKIGNWQGGKMTKNCLYCDKEFSFDKYRKDVVKFCSRSCRAKASTGVNGHNYKGGITSDSHKARTSLNYTQWRKNCLERDNFTCQKTGISGGELHIHHINNFSEFLELRYSVDNGITLSQESHREFHKIYGNKNNTQEQLTEFLLQ